jgi:hypothetical protein
VVSATACCSSVRARSERRCRGLLYWRELGSLFVTALCTTAGAEGGPAASPPAPREELAALAAAAPPMTGAEYLTAGILESL